MVEPAPPKLRLAKIISEGNPNGQALLSRRLPGYFVHRVP